MDEYSVWLSGAFARVLTDPFLAEICEEVDHNPAFSIFHLATEEEKQ